MTHEKPKKNISLSERLKLQAANGVGGTMDFISNVSAKPEEKLEHIETVVESQAEQAKETETVNRIETVAVPTEKIDGRTTRRKSGKFVDKFTFSFPEEEKREFKAFAAVHGISITDLIMFSLEYLKTDVDDGLVSLSRYGVKKLG